MADTPTPRSYSQILDDILNAFLSRYGIKRLKVGGPILSFIEAAAQSDTRSTQDVFNLLNSISVDRATSQALDNIANDENVPRIPTSPATGYVDFTDTSFSKISTNLFPGAPGPNAGALIIKVNNASSFPSTGNLYIGRGSTNYEGPLAYTSVISSGSYWTISLSTGTTKSHNVNETVILAQGGTRTISSGTIVQTPVNSISGAVKFSVLASKQIEDGEILAENVEVIAQNPGIEGNVSAFTVQEVSNPPFQGATVTNPLPFTNGTSIESDSSLRDRIKDARQSRSKGTSLAITNAILGASSAEDNKTVISSSIVKTQDRAFLYIDDGTGYEESLGHVSQETLVDSALGGEIYFQLSSGRPIAKASVESLNGAPFDLKAGSKLTVEVGGIPTEHTFSESQFRNIGTATAYEVVSSINSDKNILFNARTSRNGLGVVLFAKSDINEEIQVVRSTSNDANDILNFPTGLNYTIRLFKNDIMLYKDGQKAILTSNSQDLWEPSVTSGDTLKIKVDGTAEQTVTILNSSFLDNTTYSTVLSTNSLDSWVTVLNTLITGTTASKSGDKIILVSNLDNSSRAKVEITGGTLVTKGMFDQAVSVGADSDYTLNKNLGQIKLNYSLDSLDSLVVLTNNTRASISSGYINSSLTLAAANVWFVVDDVNAQIRKTGIVATQSLPISNASGVVTFTCTSGQLGTPLNPYIKVGDWAIIWDPGFGPTERGVFRVLNVFPSGPYFEIEVPTGYTTGTRTLTNGGLVFVRSSVVPQTISIPGGTYSLVALSGVLNSSLIGAFSDVYRNTYLRVTTDTYQDTIGSVMVATADIEGQKLLLETGVNKNNYPSHFASTSSQNSELGTPEFKWYTVTSFTSPTVFNTAGIDFDCGPLAVFRKKLQAPSNSFYGNNSGHRAVLFDITSSTLTTRSDSKTTNITALDRYFTANTFLFGSGDTLGVLVDNDYDHKSFSVPLFRRLNALTGQVYGTAPFEVRDADNSNAVLSTAFGSTTTLFNDFALMMNARGKSYPVVANKTILWRYAKYGPEGENVKISFVNPSAPSISTPTVTTSTSGGVGNIEINMGSGSERTGLGLSGNNYFVTSGVETVYGPIAPSGATISRVGGGIVTVTLGPTGTSNVHSLEIGDWVRLSATQGDFNAGSHQITVAPGNSFSYAESGSVTSVPLTGSFNLEPRPAGTTFTVATAVASGGSITATIGAHIYKAGDIVAFTPTFVSGIAIIASNPKTLTSVTPTTVTWAEGTTAGTYSPGAPYSISTGLSGKTAISYYKTDVAIGSMVRTLGNFVTVTVATTNLIDSHPYQVGDIVYLSPSIANFTMGPKIVTARISPTVFSFTDSGSNVLNTIAVTFSSTSTDPSLGFVIVDDIVHVDANSSLKSTLVGNHRVHEVSSTRFYILSDILDTENRTPSKINALANLRFYPLTKPTAASVCSLITSTYSSLASAKLVPAGNLGTATIDRATKDEFYINFNNATYSGSTAISVDKFSLYDGINFIEATDAPNSEISLKNPVSGELVSDADFDNETFRLVPKTAINVVNWLNHNAVSGLANNATSATDRDGGSVQLTSNTIGNSGAIQVNGGLGNLSSSVVIGVGESINNVGKISVDPSQDSGFSGNQWVYVQGAQKAPKILPTIGTLTITATVDPNEWLITSNVPIVSAIPVSISTKNYQIEKHGNFMAYIDYSGSPTNISSVQEGDRVSILSSTMNAANQGDFAIVKVDSSKNTFWVENPSGVEELVTCVALDTISFTTYDSVAKGDVLNISSNVMGSSNNGQFTVSRLDTLTSFYVNGTLTAIGPVTLGTNAKFIKIIEKTPIKLIKKIKTLIRNAAGNTDVLFYSDKLINKISENVESMMYAMDKLNFDTHVVSGLDGYSYNTGLLAEVHKIVYGDETSSSIYPGIAATPAKIDISGPLIKRISVTLEVRLKQNNTDTITRIKSAVASIINSSKVGVSIAISDIVEAANRVDGVMAVTVLSPLYSSGNDLIPIQSNEKPRILDVNADVAISVVS